MKKIFLLAAALITSVTIYMNAESPLKCEVCNNGTLKKANQRAIFEISEKGLQPKFDAVFLKCDHCQSLTPTKEYNGYFSIPSPK
jgi:hypothetical protein